MSVKPILFNTEMVKAILDGRKSCTRRVVKIPSYIQKQENGSYTLFAEGSCYQNKCLEGVIDYIKRPYQLGDILYVRETWGFDKNMWLYKADFTDEAIEKLQSIMRWNPSIHMPKEAARIRLKVTDVRVERLHDITTEQILKEGLYIDKNFQAREDVKETGLHLHFMKLWDSTVNKQDLDKYGWNANPFVWVIEFERCEKSKECE